MNIVIRPAKQADSEQILGVLKSTFTHTWEPVLTGTGKQHAENMSERQRDYVTRYWSDFYVAEFDNEIVGMAHWYDKFLEALHVSHAHQGVGAGSHLLTRAVSEISKSFDEARLETDTFNIQARGFYAKHGFEEVDTYPDKEWHSDFTTVLMVKSLKR